MTIIQNTLPCLDRPGSRALLNFPDFEIKMRANALREKKFANEIKVCAIINIKSGHCDMDCAFCAQNIHSTAIFEKYPLMDLTRLRQQIEQMATLPINNIGLVASGSVLAGKEFEKLCLFLEGLPASLKRKLCVSLGKLSKAQISALKKAGINHGHHNLETSEKHYKRIVSTQKWRDRLETVHNMLDFGMEVCCGGIFGIGETWLDRMELALTLGKTGIGNIPINFLDPRPGTKLGASKKLSAKEALKIIGIFRNILPESTIRICGGRNALKGHEEEAFTFGANALMTGDFLTTKGVPHNDDLARLKCLNYKVAK